MPFNNLVLFFFTFTYIYFFRIGFWVKIQGFGPKLRFLDLVVSGSGLRIELFRP